MAITQPLPSGARERDHKMRIGGRVTQIRHASKHLVFLVVDNSEGGFQALLSKGNYEGLGALGSEDAVSLEDTADDDARPEDSTPPAKKQFQDLVKLLRRGDWVGLHGFPGKSGKGEPSLIVTCAEMLAPCEVNLPEPGQLRDTGLRAAYRHRDLVVNGEAARESLIVRSHVLRGVRSVMEERGYIEVETPILQAQAGGASAKPFLTHAEATNRDLSLRIAPELPLKTLVVGGMERVFEMGRVFRNEGMDATHNPEFTTCEAYGAYDSIEDLIDLTEAVVRRAAAGVAASMAQTRRLEDGGQRLRLSRRFVDRFSGGSSEPTAHTESDEEALADVVLDLGSPFRRVSIPRALETCLGRELPDLQPLWEATANSMSDKAVRDAEDALASQLLDIMRAREMELPAVQTPEKLFDTLISALLEQDCTHPTLLMDHPTLMSPLARGHDDTPWLSQRFELFVCGRELCNAYSELNDPAEQRRRFESQARAAGKGDDEAQLADEAFLGALQHGLPPTGGWGLGIDRLVMLLSEKHHIRDAIAFPMTRR